MFLSYPNNFETFQIMRIIWKNPDCLISSGKLAIIWKNPGSFEAVQKMRNHLENPDSFNCKYLDSFKTDCKVFEFTGLGQLSRFFSVVGAKTFRTRKVTLGSNATPPPRFSRLWSTRLLCQSNICWKRDKYTVQYRCKCTERLCPLASSPALCTRKFTLGAMH